RVAQAEQVDLADAAVRVVRLLGIRGRRTQRHAAANELHGAAIREQQTARRICGVTQQGESQLALRVAEPGRRAAAPRQGALAGLVPTRRARDLLFPLLPQPLARELLGGVAEATRLPNFAIPGSLDQRMRAHALPFPVGTAHTLQDMARGGNCGARLTRRAARGSGYERGECPRYAPRLRAARRRRKARRSAAS